MAVYKRILALALSLILLLSLAACAMQGEDYGDFVPPEETDTLVVYGSSVYSYLINNAITLFKREYPNVEVEYRRYTDWMEDAFDTSLQAELAAGEGPDIMIHSEATLFTDLHTYKAMENSVYADLAPFFAWDKSIDLADYNEKVMNAGVYKGCRYMVPLGFDTMVWFTTQEILNEAGLDIQGGRQDFVPFMDRLREYKRESPDKTILCGEMGSGRMLWLLCPWCGIEAVNVEERQVTVDTEQWRALIEAYKDLFYEDDWVNRTLAPQGGVYLLDRETLFEWESNMSGIAILYAALKETQTPVLLNCPSFDGQAVGQASTLACIREGSPNQLNAWRFLKILMSEELQSEKTNYGMSFPILRSAAKTRLTDLFAMNKTDVSEEEIDAILDTIYEVDDCRFTPLLYAVLDELLFPYIEEGRSYESCLLTLEDKLTLMLNE